MKIDWEREDFKGTRGVFARKGDEKTDGRRGALWRYGMPLTNGADAQHVGGMTGDVLFGGEKGTCDSVTVKKQGISHFLYLYNNKYNIYI